MKEFKGCKGIFEYYSEDVHRQLPRDLLVWK